MYSSIWSKYLPVIRILLKKALAGDQQLNLDVTDFERAGMGRKAGYKFLLKLKHGKIENIVVNSPLAAGLAQLMFEDEGIRELVKDREYHLTLNPKFQLSIKYVPELETVEHE
jgi:hypothetical protein